MRIEITGEEFELPKEAQELKDPYYIIACSLLDYDNCPELKKVICRDKKEWAEYLLRRGHEDRSPAFAYAAAFLVNSINEPLELALDGRKPSSLGSLMDRGKIIVRGNLGKDIGNSMRGGYIFVDGNAEQISSPLGGVIYIRGDVGELEQIYDGVLIIAGNVGMSSKRGAVNCDTPVKPSPFVFTSQPVHLFGYEGYMGYGKKPERKSIVIDRAELARWSPDELEDRSLELCKKYLSKELDRKKRKLNSLKSAEAAVKFFEREIDGYHEGYGSGYREGMLGGMPSED
ncbi:MAG: hypothetical protein QMD85_01255 [Candidatus Aenigmarchaeota archaeon]|nr:hypothetical protein [Candidatus Aenigmarchaeota archaeon]MDI6722175.1 hypothetical protein [Candidatus Aenigmarchaeota archaeon]